jgi:hypothetical protein
MLTGELGQPVVDHLVLRATPVYGRKLRVLSPTRLPDGLAQASPVLVGLNRYGTPLVIASTWIGIVW